ncbi:hypothetical protein DYY67_1042 [Candidatus Nitrosotalea sp. TS]|uniref:hypothetical protein n=1 Tax=Candidatus Nitrosotalea sp. TS TaxID=2341020 RepID=UPI001409C69D|nr:hypothetical protein [Candidatus Nitrosotalea sp. TS]NHI03211.1 hypothetical protein [Candidatus Nitrosotalea sp. TS]
MILRKRTDFVTAIHRVLEILKTGEPYTLNKLGQETNLNFRTVKKILSVLESNQTLLSGRSLDVSELDNVTVVRIKEKIGLTFYPENIQNLIIRTMYYPTSSREEEILVYLYLNNAINISSAIHLPEDNILKELTEAEHVEKTDNGKYYLTSDGQYVAKGALKLYPELANISSNSSNSMHAIKIEQFMQLSIPSGPNMLLLRSKAQARKNMS